MTASPDTADGMSLLEEAGLWCIRMADGSMTDKEQAAFAAWLSQSDQHRLAFEDIVRTWHGIDEISLQPDIIAFRAEALDGFGATNRRRWAGRFSGYRQIFAVAASLVLMLLAYGIYAQFAFASYVTATGERRVIVLDDGSRISLDADTNVRVRYGGSRRELQLVHGRAKFDVAKDPLRPFTVTAADRMVIATGTEFSVELLGRKVHVILYEGHVAVMSDRGKRLGTAPVNASGTESRMSDAALMPGRELVADISTDLTKIVPADPALTLTWEAGMLSFADEPLQSAVERMNRYSNEKMAVGTAAAARTPVNGVYSAGNSAAFIEGVTSVVPLRVEDRAGVKTFMR